MEEEEKEFADVLQPGANYFGVCVSASSSAMWRAVRWVLVFTALIQLDLITSQKTDDTATKSSDAIETGMYRSSSRVDDKTYLDPSFVTPDNSGVHNASLREYPFMALIVLEDGQFCSGILVTYRRVLTSARCVYMQTNFKVVFGEVTFPNLKPAPGSQRLTVKNKEQVSIHPQYESDLNTYDIAIVTLRKRVRLCAHVKPIRLAEQKKYKWDGSNVHVVYWTANKDNPGHRFLQAIEHTVIGNRVCSILLNVTVTYSHLCSESKHATEVEPFNVGGAVVSKGRTGSLTLVAITSYSDLNSAKGFPRIGTRIFKVWDWFFQLINAQGEDDDDD